MPVAEFLRELQTLHDLSGHPNIVELEGVLYKPLSLVLEIMDGSLANFLDDKNWQLSCNMDVKFGILADIASGLSHMHKKLYIHRDIKVCGVLCAARYMTSVCFEIFASYQVHRPGQHDSHIALVYAVHASQIRRFLSCTFLT